MFPVAIEIKYYYLPVALVNAFTVKINQKKKCSEQWNM